MKKVLAAIVAASFLTIGTGIGHCCEKETNEKYTECLEKYKDLVPEEDYVIGEILIGFDKGTTPKEAEEFIENHDYNNELEMEQRRLKWFNYAIVKVPEGKEIDYACYFDSMKDYTVVDNAEPNLILRIEKFPE